jgi:hypothetical protein
MPAVVSFATMPRYPTQPEETGPEDESPEDEAQRSAGHQHGSFDDDGPPRQVTNLPTVEPEVSEDESMLVDEYGERDASPGRKRK